MGLGRLMATSVTAWAPLGCGTEGRGVPRNAGGRKKISGSWDLVEFVAVGMKASGGRYGAR